MAGSWHARKHSRLRGTGAIVFTVSFSCTSPLCMLHFLVPWGSFTVVIFPWQVWPSPNLTYRVFGSRARTASLWVSFSLWDGCNANSPVVTWQTWTAIPQPWLCPKGLNFLVENAAFVLQSSVSLKCPTRMDFCQHLLGCSVPSWVICPRRHVSSARSINATVFANNYLLINKQNKWDLFYNTGMTSSQLFHCSYVS